MNNKMTELGELVKYFPGRRLKPKDLWWILLGLLVWIAPLAYAGWLFQGYRLENGLLAAYYWVQPYIMMAYLAFLILFSYLSYRFWSGNRFVGVYQNGLRWRLKGIKIHSMLWCEVEGIACATTERMFFRKAIRDERQAILYRTNKTILALDERIEDFTGLIEAIKSLYYPTILPNLMTSFQNGQQVQFGPIAIQKSCFYVARAIPNADFSERVYQPKGMQALPWTELNGLTVTSGFLMVKSGSSRTRKIPVSQIPNFEILLKIVEQGVNT